MILKLESRLGAKEQVLCIDYNGGGGNKDTDDKELEDLNINGSAARKCKVNAAFTQILEICQQGDTLMGNCLPAGNI